MRPSARQVREANADLGDRAADVVLTDGRRIDHRQAGVVRVDGEGVYSIVDGSRLPLSSVQTIGTVDRGRSSGKGAFYGALVGYAGTFGVSLAVLLPPHCSAATTPSSSFCLNTPPLIAIPLSAVIALAGALAGAIVGATAGGLAGDGSVISIERR